MVRLNDIAAGMIHRAEYSGSSIYDLPRGLRLELEIDGQERILTLSRPAVAPSAKEVAICQRAFGALDGADIKTDDYITVIRWTKP